jgi:hypothetical protein
MNKKNILIFGFLIVFFGTAYIQYKNTIPVKKVVSVVVIAGKQTITVDDKKSQNIFKIKKGSTALQLLTSTHRVISKGERQNAYVTMIDGREASITDKEFWSFYVNGKQAQVGAGSYFLKNNDTIEWKIETY